MPKIALLGRGTLSWAKKTSKPQSHSTLLRVLEKSICSKKKPSKILYVHLWQNGRTLNRFKIKLIFTILEPTMVSYSVIVYLYYAKKL